LGDCSDDASFAVGDAAESGAPDGSIYQFARLVWVSGGALGGCSRAGARAVDRRRTTYTAIAYVTTEATLQFDVTSASSVASKYRVGPGAPTGLFGLRPCWRARVRHPGGERGS